MTRPAGVRSRAMNTLLVSIQPLLLALLPILAGYAVVLIRAHVKSSAASDALQAVLGLAETAATAAIQSASPEAALTATVTTLRRLAASEVAYLESVKGVPAVGTLLQGIASAALASVSPPIVAPSGRVQA